MTREGGDKEKLDLSPEYKDLVSKVLETCPDKRITIPGILSHPWMGGEKAALISKTSPKVSPVVGNISLVVPEILFI